MTNLGYTPEEAIVAVSTAMAPGAIGVVRCSGKNSIELTANVFSRRNALLEAKGNTLVYGWIINRAEENAKIDEVMLGVYRAPKSYTGEDMVEIFCHGGLSVVNAIYNLLLKNGFRKAQRGEFTFRAYVNGKTDLTKAEAIKEIIDSKTESGRNKAASRLAGSLYSEIDSIKKLIVDTLASIQVEIEYPEDEETISETFDSKDLLLAKERLSYLVDSWKSEKLYQDGARVVLCGKTNAGKSSLFNSMLKEERAIVSDIEGTTRDWIESWIDIEGIPIRLFDTAGLRKTDDLIEARGVELTKDLSEDADLLLYLVDSRFGLSNEDKNFISSQNQVPKILVWNKCDFEDSMKCPSAETMGFEQVICISAKNGYGIGNLSTAIKNILLKGKTKSKDGCALGSERQKVSVQNALECVEHALQVVQEAALGLDAVVQDLEDSLDFLGEVTGSVTPEDILSSVFANFCVGK